MVIRRGEPADVTSAVAVWRAANTARRRGRPVSPEHEARVRGYVSKPDAFLVVADDGEIVGMALGMQGLADDGAGPPLPGLCHVAMVFVAPDRWGEGIGGSLVDALLGAALHTATTGFSSGRTWTIPGRSSSTSATASGRRVVRRKSWAR